MEPRIVTLNEKKLVGIPTKMSLSENRTGQLWSQFALRIKEIKNRVGRDSISLQVYPPSYFESFDPTNQFTKWATVEVATFDVLPEEMETFLLPGGQYAVFYYKGSSSDRSIFQYIYSTWLPGSNYTIDHRPHFEVLGEKYQNNDPNSEEEIWIPIVE